MKYVEHGFRVCPGKILAIAVPEEDLHRLQEFLGNDTQVLVAASLDQAVACLACDRSVCVVFCDTEGIDPWPRALQRLLTVRPTSRVVLLSRLADERMWIETLEAGAHDLLLTPFDKMELVSIVRSAILHCDAVAA